MKTKFWRCTRIDGYVGKKFTCKAIEGILTCAEVEAHAENLGLTRLKGFTYSTETEVSGGSWRIAYQYTNEGTLKETYRGWC